MFICLCVYVNISISLYIYIYIYIYTYIRGVQAGLRELRYLHAFLDPPGDQEGRDRFLVSEGSSTGKHYMGLNEI